MITSQAQKWIKKVRRSLTSIPAEYRGQVLNTVIFMLRADGDLSLPKKRGPKSKAQKKEEAAAALKLEAMRTLGALPQREAKNA